MRNIRRAFSLPELLVVIGIIALLLAILMPAVTMVRKSARSAVCLSNLHQLGSSFLLYLNASHGHSFPNPEKIENPVWWEILDAYRGAMRSVILCPEATEPGNVLGSADTAWGPERTFSVGAPQWVLRAEVVGSYGFNGFLYELPADRQAVASKWWLARSIRPQASHSAQIPVFADCIMSLGLPEDTDTVPSDLIHPLPWYSGIGPRPKGPRGSMALFCIDRHRLAVNAVFLDGHAERVSLADLWKLRWNAAFKPVNVTVP